ncbi:MAG TPA: hypothetical protein DEA08_12775, partial [Planctomycetes bacterium]|nr:hypothetical protein [Planctomycetota bacterium]
MEEYYPARSGGARFMDFREAGSATSHDRQQPSPGGALGLSAGAASARKRRVSGLQLWERLEAGAG